MYSIELVKWQLANGKSPVMYGQAGSFSDAPKEKTITYIEKMVRNSIALKDEAGTLFRSKDFEGARAKYLEALNAMKYLGEGLDNEQKAIVFELTVPCHNNLALCSLQMHDYSEASIYARNGIMLVSAIEDRIDSGKVWQHLVARGMTEKKLKNEWKKKSYFLAGKADLMRREYAAAVTNLEAALKLTVHDDSAQSTAVAEEAKLRELLQIATKKRSAELKKEKNTWAKAFEKNNKEPEPAPQSHSQPQPGSSSSSSGEGLSRGGGVDLTKAGVYGDVFASSSSGSGYDDSVDEEAQAAAKRKAQDETLGWVVGVGLVVCAAAAGTAYYLRSRR